MERGNEFVLVTGRNKAKGSKASDNRLLATGSNNVTSYPQTRLSKKRQKSGKAKLIASVSFDSVESLRSAIESNRTAMGDSPFSSSFMESCTPTLERFGDCLDVVCYGVGSLCNSEIARQQMAFAILLRETLKLKGEFHSFEPKHSNLEKEVLGLFNCKSISANECCKRTAERATLFFMPHCGEQLYNNLLWANWSVSSLKNVVVIGNSFSRYVDGVRFGSAEKILYIQKVTPLMNEIPIDNSFERPDVFNDLSVHCFDEEKILAVSAATWEDRPPPYVDEEDPEVSRGL